MNLKPLWPGMVFAAGLALAPAGLRAGVERTVTREFAVAAGSTLALETYDGNIRVQPGAADTVTVVIRENTGAATEAEAEAMLKKLRFAFYELSGTLTVTARYQGVHEGIWAKFLHTRKSPVRLDFVVTVPARFNLDLRTYHGGITVGDLAGSVRVRSAEGGLALGVIAGPVRGRAAGGSIQLAAGGAEANLATTGGDIVVGKVAGPAALVSSGGGITVGAADNTVQARTAGGSIRVAFAGPLRGNCELLTSGGSIEVAVDPRDGFYLDAKTSGGRVTSALPVARADDNAPDATRLVGRVNAGGGPRLRLRSAGGSIRVESN